MASAAKTSEDFVGVDPEYAVYTNDVDKPLAATAKAKESEGDKPRADQSEATEPKTDDTKTASRTKK